MMPDLATTKVMLLEQLPTIIITSQFKLNNLGNATNDTAWWAIYSFAEVFKVLVVLLALLVVVELLALEVL
jgi:hypothetical protein